MRETRILRGARRALSLSLGLSFVLLLFTGVYAQQTTEVAAPAPSDADAVQRRITRARALAAVGKLAAAAAELESLRSSTSDDSVRDVAGVLLMGIYVEMPDYGRAGALLEEAYKSRASQTDATRTYYALAGQTVKSVRAHVERYRSFGINVAEEELPAEAKGDLDQLRSLTERVLEQARGLREETKAAATDGGADALIEDAATVRLRLARGDEERARWRQEISDARQRLVAGETRITKISDGPVSQSAPTAPVAAHYNSFAPAAAANAVAIPEVKAKKQAKDKTTDAAKSAAPLQLKSAAQPAESQAAGGAATGAKTGGAPVSVGALHAKVARKIDPIYPSLAKMARISGVVTVYVVVDENGAVEAVQRADGPAQLQGAASDAVRRWKFKPTVIDGQPARVSGYINFNFSL